MYILKNKVCTGVGKYTLQNKVHTGAGVYILQYQPSDAGGTRSLPATLHRLQNPRLLGVKQLLLSRFLDPSTPSMRKGRDGMKKNNGGKKEL